MASWFHYTLYDSFSLSISNNQKENPLHMVNKSIVKGNVKQLDYHYRITNADKDCFEAEKDEKELKEFLPLS